MLQIYIIAGGIVVSITKQASFGTNEIMAEPQFPSAKIAAMDDRQIQFLSSLNSVFKEYPDEMQSLPKMIDFFLQTSSPRSNDVVENR